MCSLQSPIKENVPRLLWSYTNNSSAIVFEVDFYDRNNHYETMGLKYVFKLSNLRNDKFEKIPIMPYPQQHYAPQCFC